MDFQAHISNLIAKRLTELNMTNAELADEIGISRSTVGDWIQGISVPKSDKVVPICNKLKITVYEFFGVPDSSNMTEDERKLLEAYKSNPEMQDAVKRLLGIN